ncbi:dynamin family protein [Bacillus sp. FJAT-45037]|uniref:dynamin family protein n=1 Tax=Bacillus sp. FJAT-45037 TaxID=2011007 RepID=UPI000C242F87|nr:dynamin family protein [Bacillus sp. FJAT-45037]
MNVDIMDMPLIESEKQRMQMINEKEKKPIFEVAFCGHFSAGKSTILNELLGAEVLPTSPIPTSANIIGIKNGELGLYVKRMDQTVKEWHGEIPWNRVREWGMNGSDISQMTIFAPLTFMNQSSVIYDTPGVDSTDPTHQAVTMEALYTTDLIVYVMDYNHIQSETNLYFLKQLSDENKPLFIIINQVDKHDESELPFAAFKQSVIDGFHEWGITPLDLYFTSMKQTDHPLNQFDAFKTKIKSILHHSDEVIQLSALRLKESFYLSVARRLEEEKQEAIQDVLEKLEEKGFDKEDLKQKEQVQQKQLHNEMAHQKVTDTFEEEWIKLSKDVTIFPYETTELAREWIASMDPSFKVGLFFSKKKTEEEQTVRLRKLISSTQDKLKSQLEFHIHRLFEQMDKSNLSNQEEVEKAISSVHFTIQPIHFTNEISAGHHERDYVFTFTKERTQFFIKQLRKQAEAVLELHLEGLEEHWEAVRVSLNAQLNYYKEIETFTTQIKEIEEAFDHEKSAYYHEAAQYKDQGHFESELNSIAIKSIPIEKDSSVFDQVTLPTESVIETEWESDEQVAQSRQKFDEDAANLWLGEVRELIEKEPSPKVIERERKRLLSRIDRYSKRSFMISLFGAFSAGKSSFANALLGEQILPVSPHPTTATVTTVRRSTTNHQHLSVVVEVKSKEQLELEIKSVAKQLDETLTLEDLKKWRPSEQLKATSWQRTYVSYLLTLKESLKSTEWKLGCEMTISHEELGNYVANEAYACLIHHVTIYYDCPLTLEGIVLVDTPGVNSIHGRHTNVAFTQLRESDAIFYVTYYNHAFSKSDQHFLTQIGKVNDRFSHDKLYFILNAADLASSAAELNGVKKHIYDQLLTIGINEPRLYPLSSKKGLVEKQKGTSTDTMFAEFEAAFYSETIEELKQLSFTLVQEEAKTYTGQLQETIAMVYAEDHERDKKLAKRKELVGKWKDWVGNATPASAKRRTEQEINELFLYLRERVQYVLNDQFIQYINVTTVTGKSKKAQQQSFVAAVKEWRNRGNHFLSQELEATYLRIEASMQEALVQWMKEIEHTIKKELATFYVDIDELEVTFKEEREGDLLSIKPEAYLTYLSSLRAFFEEGGSRRLKDQLVADGTEQARDHLLQLEKNVMGESESLLESLEGEMKKQIIWALELEFDRLNVSMTNEEREFIEQEYQSLQEMI